MTPESIFTRITHDLTESSEHSHGGVIYIALDREHQLRAQVGYTGLFKLVRQIRKVLMDGASDSVDVVRLGLSSLVMRVPSTDSGDVMNLAQELFDSLKHHSFKASSKRLAVTVSMSVSRLDYRFTDADEMLFALARRAEELAGEGGNALAVVEPRITSGQALKSSDHMLGLLMESLRNNTLKVVFQSLLATDGNESVRAYQMLPRLQASDGRLIAAAEFIPVARDASLLPVIDRWMVTHAMRLLRGPFRDHSICLFVNQSDALLTSTERQTWLGGLLEKSPELQNRMVMELSLDDAMGHMDGTAELFRIVRAGNAEVCLSRVDEQSRWDLLGSELKSDYLRMSPGFGKRLVHDSNIEKRFMELSAPVRKAGTRIIMPMVEDSQTAATLWRCGADYMQGNMIQAPEDSIAI